jgi:23S rRNA U2552 (ribose-2'-O)-methylase RlmE/FtsJ
LVRSVTADSGNSSASQLRRRIAHLARGVSTNVRSPFLGYRFGKRLRAQDPPSPPPDLPSRPNPLEDYFDAHEQGPGIWKYRHYFDLYHRHLSKYVGREVHVVEIGVFSGGSLRMWRDYFGDRARIYGVDIEPATRAAAGDRIEVHIGDQADPRFWEAFREAVPVVDVVIEDGGHETAQQIATLEGLLPHMRGGGVYVCEDIFRAFKGFHSYVDAMTRHLHSLTNEQFLRHVESVHTYPYVTVIEKPERPPPPIHAAKHGTEWEGFLGNIEDL